MCWTICVASGHGLRMNRLVIHATLGIICGIFLMPAVEARLILERVEGYRRVCVYQVIGAAIDREKTLRAVRVGLGERCPMTYRPRATSDAERPPAIPSMATLVYQNLESGMRVCHYSHLGQRYTRSIPSTQTCPMTPTFAR